MKDFGLVLAGGGGKGAYQVGVWKCLREYGMDRHIKAVSGTSVGALNAALVTQGDLEKALELWEALSADQILAAKTAEERLHSEDILAAGRTALESLRDAAGTSVLSMATLQATAETMIGGSRGIFSRSGLLSLMEEGIDFGGIAASAIPCFVTCLSFPALKVERFDLRTCSPEEGKALLLASSAIPLVFNAEHFRERAYYDGGVPGLGDNVPVRPIYDLGLRNILVIHLDRGQPVDREEFPGAHIYEVTPSVDLGNFFTGALNFSAETARLHIGQGYGDMKAILDPFADWE